MLAETKLIPLKTAYLVVDAFNVLAILDRMFDGKRVDRRYLPRWSMIINYFREKYPDFHWKALYFCPVICSDYCQNPVMCSYDRHLLKSGFKILNIATPLNNPSFDHRVDDFKQLAVSNCIIKTFTTANKSNGSELIVFIGHDNDTVNAFRQIKDQKRTCLACFPEYLPTVSSSQESTLQILDLENDIKGSFGGNILPRRFNYHK